MEVQRICVRLLRAAWPLSTRPTRKLQRRSSVKPVISAVLRPRGEGREAPPPPGPPTHPYSESLGDEGKGEGARQAGVLSSVGEGGVAEAGLRGA